MGGQGKSPLQPVAHAKRLVLGVIPGLGVGARVGDSDRCLGCFSHYRKGISISSFFPWKSLKHSPKKWKDSPKIEKCLKISTTTIVSLWWKKNREIPILPAGRLNTNHLFFSSRLPMGCHVAKYWVAGSSCTPLLGTCTGGWGPGWHWNVWNVFWGLLGVGWNGSPIHFVLCGFIYIYIHIYITIDYRYIHLYMCTYCLLHISSYPLCPVY